ncbi:NAD-dependent protein deacetylase [Kribbia dieselivorans]|uniref:NAD-dependent protein deacetylase n=1 Tax=Kribbia dieselivorans TaxID=331526 RepID=UPI0008386A6C|nr:NAD-dependent protein deacetylase [Kribbia dieselivorans]
MIEEIATLLRRAPALVLSGAGISTDSGIPDYRGPDGTRRVRPMEYGEFVRDPAARQRYWARAYVGWKRFHQAAPNSGHRAVTALQQAGAVGHVITQNVDGLHQRAGTDHVTELHGTLTRVVCLTCGDRTDRATLDDRMAAANPDYAVETDEIRPDGDVALEALDVERFTAPTCLSCGADTLKPDVVFFGESVPRDRVAHCFALTDDAPALLVIGSSLQVMSGLRFVKRAAARQIPVVVITRGPTRGDDLVTHRIDGELAMHLPRLADLVTAPPRPTRLHQV